VEARLPLVVGRYSGCGVLHPPSQPRQALLDAHQVEDALSIHPRGLETHRFSELPVSQLPEDLGKVDATLTRVEVAAPFLSRPQHPVVVLELNVADPMQMGHDVSTSTPLELARRLSGIAGIESSVATLEPLGGSGLTNRLWLVSLRDARRFVLRKYQWPYAEPDLDRGAKEAYLHHLLARRGVPVAPIVAYDDSAALMEYISGEILGEVAGRVPAEELAPAWFQAGEALRRTHSITYQPGIAGMIVGPGQVPPFADGSWGRCVQGDILRHTRHLEEQGALAAEQVARIHHIAAETVPILDEISPTLLHNDLHPWNILIRQTAQKWKLAAVLDWEYAWVGDPVWDLARFEVWRPEEIGPTPPAFYEGYGSHPNALRFRLYEMALCLWRAQAQGHTALARVDAAATNYGRRLGIALSQIEDLLPR